MCRCYLDFHHSLSAIQIINNNENVFLRRVNILFKMLNLYDSTHFIVERYYMELAMDSI